MLTEAYALWIVPPAEKVRHATRPRPGAWIQGDVVQVLCEKKVKAPFATPYGKTPRSNGIDERCPECLQALVDETSRNWDA
ncbi:hypothetical protein [Saccharopolyspora spinosa]|uniref:Uncharacterized protein n=1 Tax=Saccharopolyspora spinosa TaxID=60894 RepID=A0A2N3XUC4_SACSN|nr:hypothetical protein [Saccharopolyspora spinosa]PKW14284.1 hypothetical protein A8926_1889 [Saccharopolyspora spinosa]